VSAIDRTLATIRVIALAAAAGGITRLARQCTIETAVHCARYGPAAPPMLCRRSALLSGTSEESS
jgi:hypothetical protein